METSSVVAETLLSLIREAPTQKLPGVQLATLIRHKFAGFNPADYACRNLRHFISQHARQIQEVGRSGADVVYGVRADQPPAATPQEPSVGPVLPRSDRYLAPYIWKAFTNPRSAYRVHANTQTGELRSAPTSYGPLPPWVVVPPAAEEVHVQIARGFVERLNDPQQRAALGDLLSQPTWWTNFSGTAMAFGLGIEWRAFRRSRLIGEFERALAGARVPEWSGARQSEVAPLAEQPLRLTAAVSSPKGDEQLRRVIIKELHTPGGWLASG